MSVKSGSDLDDEQLRTLYAWIDQIPLSRPKKSISRDFSDGVLMAEIISAYFPSLVELHNYTPAHSVKQKLYNYETLNQKVLRKLGYVLTRSTIEDVVNCKPLAVEHVLNQLQLKMAKYKEKKSKMQPEMNSPVNNVNNNNNNINKYKNMPSSPPPAAMKPGENPYNLGKNVRTNIDEEILYEKDRQIQDLQETVKILELKVSKLEQLVRLKDNKIQKLSIGGGKI
jgi:hypothetical protein